MGPETEKPSLICCKTVIGFGSPNKQGTASAHGAPLGDDEIGLARKEIGWGHAPFEIPSEIIDAWNAADKGVAAEAVWEDLWGTYREVYPDLGEILWFLIMYLT